MVANGYDICWTTLTHGDLSKDMQTSVVSESVTRTNSYFTANMGSNEVLNFDYPGGKNATVKLFTLAGRMVKNVSLNGAKEVSLKKLINGLYLEKFRDDGFS